MYNKKIFQRYFDFPKRYWYKNIKYIPKYFKSMRNLIKYGYDDYALYETFDWFTYTMRSILKRYKCNHYAHPIVDLQLSPEENEKLWDDIIDKMLYLLDEMDESNPKYIELERKGKYIERTGLMESAKDEFFKLFAEHFYKMWD